jgi:tetratricopeptide (TPR) repeat protein
VTALDVAEQAAHLADVDPRRVAPVAAKALTRARREHDNAAAAIAERAWGHSLVQCGELGEAIRHLRRAIRYGTAANSAPLVDEARIRLAYALIMTGRPAAAFSEIEATLAQLNGAALARARAQRGVILLEAGRLDEALADLDAAMPALRAAGDLVGMARTLGNRGVVYAELHRFAAAIRDFRESEELCRRLGRGIGLGIIEQNLGFVEILKGDVPAALAYLVKAERTIAEHGGPLAAVLQDHGDLLLSVGLTTEAREIADRAIVASQREQSRLKVPELRLLLAQIAYLEGDWPDAIGQAGRALRGFTSQQRKTWAEVARLVALRARLAAEPATRVPAATVDSMVATLAASGWPAAHVEARVVAATLAIRRGRSAQACAHLEHARAYRRHGSATLRARGWYAEALLLQQNGDERAAANAARAGLRVLDEHGAALGATDLRVHSAAYRADLSELGLRMAMRKRRAGNVFEWAERSRASRLLHRPVLPAADPELADLLAQLRAVAGEILRLPTSERGRSPLTRRQQALERQIRDHSRLHPGTPHGRPAPPVRLATLGAALGDRVLVEYLHLDGTLYALSLVDKRLRLHELGSLATATSLVGRLHFALHQLGRVNAGARSLASASALLANAARRLDEILLGGLPIEDRPLVVVPTGELHSLTWSILPVCAGRPVSVSPSATFWHKANSASSRAAGGVLSAAGPGLLGAREEAGAVARIHRSTPLLDDAATVAAVLAALPDARIAHLAAHGSLATDNPLFSKLRLHDGPLVAYDLERLTTVPHTLVLASCDSGRSVVHTGDELLGLGATFIARGTAELVASVLPIPDAETAPLMVAMHRRIAAGRPAAAALADAQCELRERGGAELAAAASFVCIGT